jgi:hypothetical protein
VRRLLAGLFAVFAVCPLALAQQKGAPAETLIRLSLRPAPAPQPALKYRLLPELREMNPGNPIQGYMKCMMEQRKFFFDEETIRRRETLLEMPLKELSGQQLKEDGQYALALADAAARLDNPDWQSLQRLKLEGFNLLLPEVQQIRSVARALRVRLHAEIAQARFDDAVRTIKTMLAIARHLGEHPTIIGNLVGIACASITLAEFDELLQQPGCPNLYWGLTTLPRPLVRMDVGLEGERTSLAWAFREIDEHAPMRKERIDAFITEMSMFFEPTNQKNDMPTIRNWLNDRVKNEKTVSAARERLVEYGLANDRVKHFLPEQIILLDQKRVVEIRFDDMLKNFAFPFWQIHMPVNDTPPKNPETYFADTLMPQLAAVRSAQARLEQRIALFRHIEAFRVYAAAHQGKLPGKLEETGVFLPVDPVTGKPPRYELVGETAHLRGTPAPGQENVPIFNLHYEIVFSK